MAIDMYFFIFFRPEALGIVISIVFLVISIIQQVNLGFTKDLLIEYNASLLAICMVILLGFVDLLAIRSSD